MDLACGVEVVEAEEEFAADDSDVCFDERTWLELGHVSQAMPSKLM